MRYTRFKINNFKGIVDAEINLASTDATNVYTLVGLNESGKTTVLEAIHTFFRKIRNPSSSEEALDFEKLEPNRMIHAGSTFNFSGLISIEATVALSSEDEHEIANRIQKEFEFVLTEPIETFTLTTSYQFEDSVLIASQPLNLWGISLTGKGTKQRRNAPPRVLAAKEDMWQKIVSVVRDYLPTVLYFPNFLFDFPDRIYLEDTSDTHPRNTFYRRVLQDVLDAMSDGLTLEKHILERAKTENDFDRRNMEGVKDRMEDYLTKQIFGQWEQMFGDRIHEKSIRITIAKDPAGWFIQLKIKEGTQTYEISERSLGFRWFFTFLLMIKFRGFRKKRNKSILFLLDEPASNLHSTAQSQLMKGLLQFPAHCDVVYSTHSQYMINPDWLDRSFIVKNEGVNYSSAGVRDDLSRNTKVSVTSYRRFVSEHPSDTTHYQPILDLLDYRPAVIEFVPDVVMVEGKSDYYGYRLAKLSLPSSKEVNLLPGMGAGALDAVISPYLGWARNFVVILDSDTEGSIQKKRYLDKYGTILRDRIFTLEDVHGSLKGKGIEYLFDAADRLKIQKLHYPTAVKFNKKQFNGVVQELVATNQGTPLGPATVTRFTQIFEKMNELLQNAKAT